MMRYYDINDDEWKQCTRSRGAIVKVLYFKRAIIHAGFVWHPRSHNFDSAPIIRWRERTGNITISRLRMMWKLFSWTLGIYFIYQSSHASSSH